MLTLSLGGDPSHIPAPPLVSDWICSKLVEGVYRVSSSCGLVSSGTLCPALIFYTVSHIIFYLLFYSDPHINFSIAADAAARDKSLIFQFIRYSYILRLRQPGRLMEPDTCPGAGYSSCMKIQPQETEIQQSAAISATSLINITGHSLIIERGVTRIH